MKKIICVFISVLMVMTACAVVPAAATVSADEVVALHYDDRYKLETGFTVSEITDDMPSSTDALTKEKDNSVFAVSEDKATLIATATGTATVSITDGSSTKSIKFSVTAAPISMLFMLGQSNVEGNDGSFDNSIACPDGQAYSTYAPASAWEGNHCTGIEHTEGLTAQNGGNFVATTLTGNTSYAGTELVYGINGVCESGGGKSGMDSAICYEYNRQTGEKLWTINAAHAGTSIDTWDPNEAAQENNFFQAISVAKAALTTMKAEVDAGHYVLKHASYLWLQGESDPNKTAEEYRDCFMAMHKAFKQQLLWNNKSVIEFCNLLPARVCGTTPMYSYNDIRMTGMRQAQYFMCADNSDEMSDIYMATSISEGWVETDSGKDTGELRDWLTEQYGDSDVADYPTQSGEPMKLTFKAKEIHTYAHYNQCGYNELGREVGRSLSYVLGYVDDPVTDKQIKLIKRDGHTEYNDSIGARVGDELLIVPSITPSRQTFGGIDIKLSDGVGSMNCCTLKVAGSGTLSYTLGDGTTKTLQIRVVTFGDANGDGTVNGKDILLLRKRAAKHEVKVDLDAADVNRDGVVNSVDLLQIKKFYAGYDIVLGDEM